MTDQATAVEFPPLDDTILLLESEVNDGALSSHRMWRPSPTRQQVAAYFICGQLYSKRRLTAMEAWNTLKSPSSAGDDLARSWRVAFTAAWAQVKAELAAAA